jgi:beta-galactosidase
VYEPGVVRVVVYRSGQEVGADEIVTAGAAKCILANADRNTVPSDGSDICYVDISITDEYGRLNPEANTPVSIRAEGCGLVQGFGSADPESEENYYDCVARAFGGRLRAAIRANGSKGEIWVTLSAAGMADAQIRILSECVSS